MLSLEIFGKSTEYDQDHLHLMEPLLLGEKRGEKNRNRNMNQLVFDVIIQMSNVDE